MAVPLVNLGSGTLEIDALTGQCLFQGKSIGQLRIAEEIRAWMQQDLATNKISMALLTGVHTTVNLSFPVVPWNEPAREMFYSGGKAVRTEKINRCILGYWGQVTGKPTNAQSAARLLESDGFANLEGTVGRVIVSNQ